MAENALTVSMNNKTKRIKVSNDKNEMKYTGRLHLLT